VKISVDRDLCESNGVREGLAPEVFRGEHRSRLGDIYGKRRLLVVTLVAFAAGSAIAAVSANLWIVVAGRDVTERGVDVNSVRRGIGIVFQAYNLFPHMSVLKNVTLAPRKVLGAPRDEAEARAKELLARFGLADKRDEYPDRLSGGQQQRVAIVRALAMQPGLLLLDEVTSALDPELVAEVLNVIRELAAGGMTMVIATHEMGFARDIASRIGFLDAGVILEEGTPEEIFSSPREERTQRFLQSIIDAGRM